MPNVPYKPAPLSIARDASVLQLALAALARSAEQLRRNTPGAKRGSDAGYVHQLRVGARRLRVVLRLFRQLIGQARAEAVRDDLRWIFRRLGAVRDHDVLLHELIAPLEANGPTPALTALAADLRRAVARVIDEGKIVDAADDSVKAFPTAAKRRTARLRKTETSINSGEIREGTNRR